MSRPRFRGTYKTGSGRMKKIRMVRCTYVRENGGWIPMGRARTRCPSCGAVVGGTTSHQVELREPGEGDRG